MAETRLRMAWLGPAPTDEGGVAYVGTQMLRALAEAGVELHCYVAAEEAALAGRLRGHDLIRFDCEPPRHSEDAWYSRLELGKFLARLTARAAAQRRLVRRLGNRHASEPYDVYYQFSQIELGPVRRLRDRLPPIVLHPEVHMAGELRWHRREARLARRFESAPRMAAVRAMLIARAAAQRRDAALASMVVAPSRRFADHLAADYRLPPDRVRVVPNPIDLERFAPGEQRREGRPLTLLFVSRMAVRKGVEMVVDLSRRLRDLEGRVRIHVVGDQALWSDYRPLLSELDGRVARYAGSVTPADLADVYRSADGLIQPSHYEPFALTVGEALATGLPVVVSDEVGAGEGLDPRPCRVFPSGNADAFEAAVRALVEELEGGGEGELGRLARAEAERRFAPSKVAERLAGELEGLVAGRR